MSHPGKFLRRYTFPLSTLLVTGVLIAGCSKSKTPASSDATNSSTPMAVSSQANPATVGQNEAIAAAQSARQAAGSSAAQAQAKPSPVPQYIDVPAGTEMSIRLNQHISVKTSQAGDTFTGSTAAPVLVHGAEVIPKGADVEGVVAASHRRGRFKGRSILELRLISLTLNGQRYPLNTRDYARTKRGKGRRTAALIGGGSGLGMLIGGIASGGTGLLIGGLAGAGAGTAGAAFTGNRDINIPAESIINFRLADALHLQE
ncbi:MAG: hypothetical protein ACYC46_04015 [Acidobacteriaceae bacterium]